MGILVLGSGVEGVDMRGSKCRDEFSLARAETKNLLLLYQPLLCSISLLLVGLPAVTLVLSRATSGPSRMLFRLETSSLLHESLHSFLELELPCPPHSILRRHDNTTDQLALVSLTNYKAHYECSWRCSTWSHAEPWPVVASCSESPAPWILVLPHYVATGRDEGRQQDSEYVEWARLRSICALGTKPPGFVQ